MTAITPEGTSVGFNDPRKTRECESTVQYVETRENWRGSAAGLNDFAAVECFRDGAVVPQHWYLLLPEAPL